MVVGSGPTGAIAAWTLVKSGVPVTMLESGTARIRDGYLRYRNHEFIRGKSTSLWDHAGYPEFENLGDTNTRWIKAHCVGGLGAFWGGVTLRCAPQDFGEGEALGEHYVWPIGYSDLEPYYRRLESLLSITGGSRSAPALPACVVARSYDVPPEFEPLSDAADSIGRSFLPLPYVRGPDTILGYTASPRNFALRLVIALERSPRFRLIKGAHVHSVVMHRDHPLAAGVEYIDRRTRSVHRIAAKAVVLAAGPLGSPQILLNSISPAFPEGVGNRHGMLGRYLHDNPIAYYNYAVDAHLPSYDATNGGFYLTRPAYGTTEPLRAFGFQVYGGWQAGPLHANLRHDLRVGSNALTEPGTALIFACNATQKPRADNYVTIHPQAKDENGLPLLRMHFSFDEADESTLELARKTADVLLDASGWGYVRTGAESQPPGTSVHFGGTVRMHRKPEHGVLDAWNRCHEVPNLRVVDASCFTTGIEKNPVLTSAAIAMRAAEHLARNPH